MTSVCSAPDLSFPTVLAKFESFHRDPLNVALHMLTTSPSDTVVSLPSLVQHMPGVRMA